MNSDSPVRHMLRQPGVTRGLLPPVEIPATYERAGALFCGQSIAKSNPAAFQDFTEVAKRIYSEAKAAQQELADRHAYFEDLSCTVSLPCSVDAEWIRRNEMLFGTVADLPMIAGVTRPNTLDERIIDLFTEDFFIFICPTGKPGKASNNGAFGRRT